MTGKWMGKGFMSLDALFSIVPIALMVFLAMDMRSMLSQEATERSQQQVVFDKLVPIADYTVKSGAVMRNGSARYPNWIDEGVLGDGYVEDLRGRAGLGALSISLERAGPGSESESGSGYARDGSVCIYRIVVIGQEKGLGRLFVCGGGNAKH